MEEKEREKVKRSGLTVLDNPAKPLVDIVFVHGLNGLPDETWTASNGVFWPRSLLPKELDGLDARILTFGYNASFDSSGELIASNQHLYNYADQLISDLVAKRRGKASERPIVFVAHSMGGLIVKQALIDSSRQTGEKTKHRRTIYKSCYGVLFLATPHLGGNMDSWVLYLWRMLETAPQNQSTLEGSQLLNSLKLNSETLIVIERSFVQLVSEIHLFYFYEILPTVMKKEKAKIVEEGSAAPNIPDIERSGIEADHYSISKFESENSPGYDIVVDAIYRYAEAAPDAIKKRWDSDRPPPEAPPRDSNGSHAPNPQTSAAGSAEAGKLPNQPHEPSQAFPGRSGGSSSSVQGVRMGDNGYFRQGNDTTTYNGPVYNIYHYKKEGE